MVRSLAPPSPVTDRRWLFYVPPLSTPVVWTTPSRTRQQDRSGTPEALSLLSCCGGHRAAVLQAKCGWWHTGQSCSSSEMHSQRKPRASSWVAHRQRHERSWWSLAVLCGPEDRGHVNVCYFYFLNLTCFLWCKNTHILYTVTELTCSNVLANITQTWWLTLGCTAVYFSSSANKTLNNFLNYKEIELIKFNPSPSFLFSLFCLWYSLREMHWGRLWSFN